MKEVDCTMCMYWYVLVLGYVPYYKCQYFGHPCITGPGKGGEKEGSWKEGRKVHIFSSCYYSTTGSRMTLLAVWSVRMYGMYDVVVCQRKKNFFVSVIIGPRLPSSL